MPTPMPKTLTVLETLAVILVVFTSTINAWLAVMLAAAFLLAFLMREARLGRSHRLVRRRPAR